jgi:uncharacterized protein YpmS
MGSPTDHILQAEHNEACYKQLASTSTEFADWQVTTLFYSALHYVDAYLASKGHSVTDHKMRNFLVSSESQLRALATEYIELFDRSLDSRYKLVQFTPQAAQALYNGDYRAFRDAIRLMLKLSPVN